MAWMNYSYTVDARIPAPIEWVWRYLVQPELIIQSREAVSLVVTAEGQPGRTGHVYFSEVIHDHGSHAFKTKVLRGEPTSTWVTLTEQVGYSYKEYYSLCSVEGGLFTDMKFLASVGEDIGERSAREIEALRRQRTEAAQQCEELAAEYFSKVVTEAFEASRQRVPAHTLRHHRSARSPDASSRHTYPCRS